MKTYVLVEEETKTPMIAFRDKNEALLVYELFVDLLNCPLELWVIFTVG